ncbi:hypothetical protein MAR_010856, partial [Mya arenaria]
SRRALWTTLGRLGLWPLTFLEESREIPLRFCSYSTNVRQAQLGLGRGSASRLEWFHQPVQRVTSRTAKGTARRRGDRSQVQALGQKAGDILLASGDDPTMTMSRDTTKTIPLRHTANQPTHPSQLPNNNSTQPTCPPTNHQRLPTINPTSKASNPTNNATSLHDEQTSPETVSASI